MRADEAEGGPIALADFARRWRIDRVIEDRHAGQVGRFHGEASFAPLQRGLRYHEAGQLTLGAGPAFRAERAYLWHQEDDAVVVRFDDGRDFHRFPLSGASADATHPCGPDFYRVRYDFGDWPRWRAVWTVAGPRKDYTMTSDMSPI